MLRTRCANQLRIPCRWANATVIRGISHKRRVRYDTPRDKSIRSYGACLDQLGDVNTLTKEVQETCNACHTVLDKPCEKCIKDKNKRL